MFRLCNKLFFCPGRMAVLHRAFCDALTEENHTANQNLAASGRMPQSQAKELYTSSMLGIDDGSNTNIMMNLSISRDNIDNSLRHHYL